MALLEMREVSRNFGGLLALSDVSFDVGDGEILGVIGPNGAGKTTLFNAITGIFPPTRGEIILEGEAINGLKPHQIAARGVVRTFQADVLFGDFSVAENVLLGMHMKSAGFSLRQIFVSRSSIPRDERMEALAILDFVGLSALKDRRAGDLPHGHQRVLGIAVALAAEPKVLMMDEPVAGMNDDEIKSVVALIRALNEKGLTVLLVEHHIKTVMDICNRMVVLNFGKKIAEGRPGEIRQNKEVIEAYLGVEDA